MLAKGPRMGVANPGNLFSKTVILMIFSLLFENGDGFKNDANAARNTQSDEATIR